MKLEEYSDVLIYVINGSFLGSVKYDANYVAMPKGSPPLDECSIEKIENWIANGAPEN